MTEQKKCQPGEWWEYNGVRVYVAGITLSGALVCEYRDGTIGRIRQGDWWVHLEGCDSWTWQKPDWVTQDRVPARPGIDQRRWVGPDGTVDPEDDWEDCGFMVRMYKTKCCHGDVRSGNRLELRCLRKDLPPMPEVWPKYYETTVPGELAFLRRDTATAATYVLIDGTEGGAIMWRDADDFRKELTESEALSRIVKPVVLQPPPRIVTLYECVVWEYEGGERLLWLAEDAMNDWDNAHKTGNTRTIEVPA